MTTDPKYLPIARRVMTRVCHLPAPARRGMIRELGLTGVVLSADRADSYVVSRYVATFGGATRSDAWSDEARAAALEARQASKKAKETGTARDHSEAANAHSIAAMKNRNAGGSGNDKAMVHEKAAALHDKKAANGGTTTKPPAPPSDFGRHLPAATPEQIAKERSNFSPEQIAKASALLHAPAPAPASPDLKRAVESARQQGAASAMHNYNANAFDHPTFGPTVGMQERGKVGTSSSYRNFGTMAEAKAYAEGHDTRAEQIRSSMASKTPVPKLSGESPATVRGPAGEARNKSMIANRETSSMGGGGSADQHQHAAELHSTAKLRWQSVERTARKSGDDTTADRAHTFVEHHAVQASDHRYAAEALRSSKKLR